MKNMKIEVQNNLDEIVVELERLGYKRKIAPRKARKDMWIVAFQIGRYDVYRNMRDFTSIETTTLAELKKMRANEFVKKRGWGEAISLIDASKICGIDKSVVDIEELKRLVDSHELVEKRGGLRLAVVFRWSEKFKSLSREHQDKFDQAILDVESCQ